MYSKTLTHKISKLATDFLFIVNILCVIAVPFASGLLFGKDREPYYVFTFCTILVLSGICSAYILYNLKKMFKSLLCGNPFTEENTGRFRKMAVSCAVIAVIYLIKCFLIFSFGTVIVSLVFVIGCLFCLTLKDLFRQAGDYKSENELTI